MSKFSDRQIKHLYCPGLEIDGLMAGEMSQYCYFIAK